MHEPFTHAHHTEKITFSQLPNGGDKLSHVDKRIAPRAVSQTQDTDLKHPGGRLSFPGVNLVSLFRPTRSSPQWVYCGGTFALLAFLDKMSILEASYSSFLGNML